MTTKHTPGPWVYDAIGEDAEMTPEVRSGFGLVVKLPGKEDSENKANGQLIAAAPDMLSALIIATVPLQVALDRALWREGNLPEGCSEIEHSPGLKHALECVRAAIAAATGRKI